MGQVTSCVQQQEASDFIGNIIKSLSLKGKKDDLDVHRKSQFARRGNKTPATNLCALINNDDNSMAGIVFTV